MPQHKSTQDYTVILSRFPGPVTLRSSRRKWAAMLVLGLLGVAGCLFAGLDAAPSGWVVVIAWQVPSLLVIVLAWFGVAFFGLGVLMSAVILLVPGCSGLTLDRDGFSVRNLFRTSRYAWKQSSGFSAFVVGPGRLRMVGYDNTAVTGRLADWNRKTYGRNCALPDTYGLSADDLAKLLGAWGDRACGPARK